MTAARSASFSMLPQAGMMPLPFSTSAMCAASGPLGISPWAMALAPSSGLPVPSGMWQAEQFWSYTCLPLAMAVAMSQVDAAAAGAGAAAGAAAGLAAGAAALAAGVPMTLL